MPFNHHDFKVAAENYIRSQGKGYVLEDLADEIGMKRQSLQNVLSSDGQKKLGKKNAQRAAYILGWPNPEFSNVIAPIDGVLLYGIVWGVEKVLGTGLPAEQKARVISNIYNLVSILHPDGKTPNEDEILDLIRKMAS